MPKKNNLKKKKRKTYPRKFSRYNFKLTKVLGKLRMCDTAAL